MVKLFSDTIDLLVANPTASIAGLVVAIVLILAIELKVL